MVSYFQFLLLMPDFERKAKISQLGLLICNEIQLKPDKMYRLWNTTIRN